MTNLELNVDMACYALGRSPEILIAKGLGSCVAVSFYNSDSRIGALGHIMLPDSRENTMGGNPLRFADKMIGAILAEFKLKKISFDSLEAKIVGGANMFPFLHQEIQMIPAMGEKNVTKVKEILKSMGISIVGEETGGNYGRSVHFHLDTGILTVEKKI